MNIKMDVEMERLHYKKHLLEKISKLQQRCTDSSNGSVSYPGYAKPTTPFRPYNDYYINLDENPYENCDSEPKTEVDDLVLGKFVNTLLTNQALALASRKEYHEEFDGNSVLSQDKIPSIYKVRPNHDGNVCNERLPRKKTRQMRQSRSRRYRSDDDRYEAIMSDIPAGGELNMVEGTLMVNIPFDMLRQYLFSEVEARVWSVNAHYKREWEIINRERMVTLAELVLVQETSRKVKAELEEMMKTLKTYQDLCESLGSKVETTKEARRRRRQAKKQRKTTDTQPEAGDGDNNLKQGAEEEP